MRQKAEFEDLLRHGARRNLDGYTMYVARRDSGAARLGMLISRRHAARAVVRNRIKRCIREAFRLEQERLGPVDVLVRPPYGVKPSAQMVARLRAIFGRLSQ
ncbi:MAG TPA: ribonuclease P protein component [Burkholderiales bacterium]|nr:ribonuclease P protein component [Burkholderiales bacterium]